jgi:CRP/FNR family transcriptional regulator
MLTFYNLLTPSEKQILENGTQTKKFEKNAVIHCHGDTCIGMFSVNKGTVSLSIVSDEGKKVTVLQFEEGSVCVFGAACIFKQVNFDVQLEAKEACVIEIVNVQTMTSLMELNLSFEAAVYKLATSSLSGIVSSVQQFLFLSIGKRIANYLLAEQKRYGDAVVSATHEQIAHFTGSAREVVTRELNKMAKQGLISLGRKTIEILDPENLKTYR